MKTSTDPRRWTISFSICRLSFSWTRRLSFVAIATLFVAPTLAFAETIDEEVADARFRRGDANGDGSVDVADCILTLDALFLGDVEIGCADAADVNDDGSLDVADAATGLSFLFGGGLDLPYPGATRCGVDPTDEDRLGCLAPQACGSVRRKAVVNRGGGLGLQPGSPFNFQPVLPVAPPGPRLPNPPPAPAPPAPPPEAPGGVELANPDSRVVTVVTGSALLHALDHPFEGKVIYVPSGVEIDLSFFPDAFRIPAGVTLMGSRGGLDEGGLIFSDNEDKKFLFEVRGHDVRIEGLRFRGPSPGKSRSLGIVGAIQIVDAYRTTIINNEFYDWPHVSVMVRERLPDEDGPDSYDPEECVGAEPDRLHFVKIEGNFFHHDQRQGRGYGVKSSGAFPFIVGNTFNHHRHAIAADGLTRTSYRAHLNLVLSGGGKYCVGKTLGTICWYEHHFDMHGRGDPGHWEGGIAGQFMDIAFNTILGEQTYFGKTRAALNVRGTPCDHVTFHDNVLAHDDRGEAVREQSEADNVFVYDNRYDASLGPMGVGDFDGDGVDDLMIATGAAWYYSSGARTEWRFLKKSVKRMDQVILADFDGNGKTDVFTKSGNDWRVAHDGVGGWTTINSSGVPQSAYRAGDFDGDGEAEIFRTGGGAWQVSWSGTSRWEVIATSSYGIEDLRFGDFNGDGQTDVFSLARGEWSISWSGSPRWQRLNDRLSSDLDRLVFADFDGDGATDIGRQSGSRWQVSWAGTTPWQSLNKVGTGNRDRLSRQIIGSFDDRRGADALRVTMNWSAPGTRFELSSGAARSFVEHSRYDMR